MTKILAIDASTEACSVALLNGDEITERYQLAPREHAKLLLPMVDELLSDSDLRLSQLDAIACNTGPGAFTGIRIAVSVAQGLAYGANLPTIGLSSLANLALNGYDQSNKQYWLTAIDARMNEVYFSAYQINNGEIVSVSTEEVIPPSEIKFGELLAKVDQNSLGLIGSGWQAYADGMFVQGLSKQLLLEDNFPSAKYAFNEAKLALQNNKLLKPEDLQPTYLRNNVAKKAKIKD